MAEALLSGSSRARILELEAEDERLRKTHAQEQNERIAAGAELGRLRGALNAADNEKARLREEVERLREAFSLLRWLFLNNQWYIVPESLQRVNAQTGSSFETIRDVIDRVRALEGNSDE